MNTKTYVIFTLAMVSLATAGALSVILDTPDTDANLQETLPGNPQTRQSELARYSFEQSSTATRTVENPEQTNGTQSISAYESSLSGKRPHTEDQVSYSEQVAPQNMGSRNGLDEENLNQEELIQRQERRHEELLQEVDSRFTDEDVDASWSTQQEVLISDAFSTEEWQQSTLVGARCKSTICRLDLLHNSDSGEASFLTSLGATEAFANTTGTYRRQENSDGSTSMTLYVARQGHSLQGELAE